MPIITGMHHHDACVTYFPNGKDTITTCYENVCNAVVLMAVHDYFHYGPEALNHITAKTFLFGPHLQEFTQVPVDVLLKSYRKAHITT